MLNRDQRRHPRVKGQPIPSTQKSKANVIKGEAKSTPPKETLKKVKKS